MGQQGKRGFSERIRKYLASSDKMHLTRPSDLGDFARSVLGLWQMGNLDPLEITGILYISQKDKSHDFRGYAWGRLYTKVCEFLELVFESKHKVTEYILDEGLPRGCGAWLPEGRSVWCPECGSQISIVPCQACTDPFVTDCTLVWANGQYERQDVDEPLKTPKWAAQCAPGSLNKIELMRRRLERGESCFHEKDRPLVPGSEKVGFWG